jgi:hypothetical protein
LDGITVFCRPVIGKRLESLFRGCKVRGSIDLFQVIDKRFLVFINDIPARVAYLVDDTELGDCIGELVGYGF